MTKRERQTDNEREKDDHGHSDSFIALVELVRHMARCAAKYDYESILKAAKENEALISEWKNKK